jgi:hypothetical protein
LAARLPVALAVLVSAAPVAAAGPRIAVVALSAPPDLTFMGKGVASMVADAAAHEKAFEIVGPDAVEKQLGRAANEALVRCADDARCLAQKSTALGVDRVIGGWLARTDATYRVVLVHADARTGARIGNVDREIPIASRRLRADVTAATPVLVRGEVEALGTLTLESDPPFADVTIDDAPAGTTPVSQELKPGKHKVQISKAGYVLREPFWVDVPARDEVTQRVTLHQIPARDRPSARTRVQVVK